SSPRPYRDLHSFPTRRSSDLVREEQLPHGQRLKGLVPEHADIDFASLDVLLDERCGADAVVDEGDALLQLLIAVDDRSLRDADGDRKSTRLNSSHEWISYAVF